MAINVPIISQFEDKGIKKAISEFKKLEGPAEKSAFAIKKAFLPAAAAVGALATAAFGAASAAIEDQASQAKLADQLVRTTGATEAQIGAVEEAIGTMQLATNVADTDLREAYSRLATVTGDLTTSQELLSLATDISTATGKDLSAVTEALARAYGGNLTALQRLDPALRESIKSGASFEEIGQQLAETYGGAATAAAETAEGRFKNLGVRMGELQETIGGLLLPIVEKLLPVLASVADFVERNTTVITILAGVVGGLAVAVIAINAAMTAYAAITKTITAVTAVFNAVLAANPIVLITLAVVALIAILVTLQLRFNIVGKAVEWLGGIFETVKQAVLRAWNEVLEWFRAVAGLIETALSVLYAILVEPYVQAVATAIALLTRLWNWIKDLPGKIGRAIATIFDILVKPFADVVDAMFDFGVNIVRRIVDGIKSIASTIGSAILDAIPGAGAIRAVGGFVGSAVSKVWPFAEGGVVTQPTLGLVGEAGPEAIIPLDRMAEMRGGGQPATVNITVTSADPNAVIEAIRSYNRQQGPAPILVA